MLQNSDKQAVQILGKLLNYDEQMALTQRPEQNREISRPALSVDFALSTQETVTPLGYFDGGMGLN